ncbi:MAG: hypothetical protein KDA85_01765 [Planctomycetaceae bacterium]|nr:hypothetical protein [Planctomycetaceae bacterium]
MVPRQSRFGSDVTSLNTIPAGLNRILAGFGLAGILAVSTVGCGGSDAPPTTTDTGGNATTPQSMPGMPGMDSGGGGGDDYQPPGSDTEMAGAPGGPGMDPSAMAGGPGGAYPGGGYPGGGYPGGGYPGGGGPDGDAGGDGYTPPGEMEYPGGDPAGYGAGYDPYQGGAGNNAAPAKPPRPATYADWTAEHFADAVRERDPKVLEAIDARAKAKPGDPGLPALLTSLLAAAKEAPSANNAGAYGGGYDSGYGGGGADAYVPPGSEAGPGPGSYPPGYGQPGSSQPGQPGQPNQPGQSGVTPPSGT